MSGLLDREVRRSRALQNLVHGHLPNCCCMSSRSRRPILSQSCKAQNYSFASDPPGGRHVSTAPCRRRSRQLTGTTKKSACVNGGAPPPAICECKHDVHTPQRVTRCARSSFWLQ